MSKTNSPRTSSASGSGKPTSSEVTLTVDALTKAFENVAIMAGTKDTRAVSWKHEIKACKEDTAVKILDTLDQLSNMAELDGIGYIFDETRCNLPFPKPDVALLDPKIDAGVIPNLKVNQKGMAMINLAFTMSQHMSEIKKSAVNGYNEGVAYLAFSAMRARAVPVKSLAPLVLNAKLSKLKFGSTEDPTMYWDCVGALKREYALASIKWPAEMHLVHLEPMLAMDSRFVSTLDKAKTSKVMAATANMTARLTEAIMNGLSGSSISLPAPVTMDNVVVTEDEIAVQMKIDHCNAHVKDPSKYPLMGEKVAAKTDRKEVSLAATDGDRKAISYKCGKCGQKGHKSADCPTKPKAQIKASGGRGGGDAGGTNSTDDRGPRIKGNCNRCGKPGHMAKYCKSKRTRRAKT